jgi:hypothetical protein
MANLLLLLFSSSHHDESPVYRCVYLCSMYPGSDIGVHTRSVQRLETPAVVPSHWWSLKCADMKRAYSFDSAPSDMRYNRGRSAVENTFAGIQHASKAAHAKFQVPCNILCLCLGTSSSANLTVCDVQVCEHAPSDVLGLRLV